jgi:hypothetical protein
VATYRAQSSDVTSGEPLALAITPAVGDLFVVFVAAVNPSITLGLNFSVSDDRGGTYTKVLDPPSSGSPRLMAFVRNSLLNTTSLATVTCTDANDEVQEVAGTVVAIAGMYYTGSSAVRSSGVQGAGSGTPAPALNQSALTGNITLGAVQDLSDPAAITPPTGWTERVDHGWTDGSSIGLEVATRDSGFTGTTITWGSAAGSAFNAIVLELDSAVPALGTLTKTLGAMTCSAAGDGVYRGQLAKTIGGLSIAAAGGPVISGSLAKSLGGIGIPRTFTFPERNPDRVVDFDRVRFRIRTPAR